MVYYLYMTLGQKNEIIFKTGYPIYLQIVQLIKGRILRGEYPLTGKLPSVRALSVILGINPNTVQKAYSELVRGGLVVMKRGIGFFVTDDRDLLENERDRLLERILKQFLNDLSSIGVSLDQVKERMS